MILHACKNCWKILWIHSHLLMKFHRKEWNATRVDFFNVFNFYIDKILDVCMQFVEVVDIRYNSSALYPKNANKKTPLWFIPADNYMFKINNKNTWAKCEICSKLTIKNSFIFHLSGAFIVNFENISHLVLVFLLLTLSR